jgi:hypothetical protein
MSRLSFTEHPNSVGESYLQHLHSAWSFSWAMQTGALACFVHGLLPFLFTRTGSSAISTLHARMTEHRMRHREVCSNGSDAPLLSR